MSKKLWWKRPLRVIQYNLQVKDTQRMNAKKIARDVEDMVGNTLVINVGGIYAWYPSRIKYHHINEYLPKDKDLLNEIINECHKRGIKIIARFDFSKTDDFVFQEKPQWFVRNADKSPKIVGKDRLGEWSLLFSTCINGGYRNEELAIPVIHEVLDQYDIDGIFFNAPDYEQCYCDTCRQKYEITYHKPLPLYGEMEGDWPSLCIKDNVGKIYRTVKNRCPDMPVILYYHLYDEDLDARMATADMICAESQNVLSRGVKDIPEFWEPSLTIKIGHTAQGGVAPFGIIHSCPGMDWRHTGLPPHEYRFWMSQIPANGGNLWHSMTGFNDTVTDKRIIEVISDINDMIARSERYMEGANSVAETLLLWHSKASAKGWAEALMSKQILFDVLSDYHVTSVERLLKYRCVIFPEGLKVTEDMVQILNEYMAQGGNVILEAVEADAIKPLTNQIGIKDTMVVSENLAASYVRIIDDAIKKNLEMTELIPHKGTVVYCEPEIDTKVLATLVPPFAPMDAVGSPPERASILTPHTNLPLCLVNQVQRGKLLFLPFQLSMLASEYKLDDHYQFMANCVNEIVGSNIIFRVDNVNGIQASLFRKNNTWLIHLVNGIGQRPLANVVPYYNLNFSLKINASMQVKSVVSQIAAEDIDYDVEDDTIKCKLSRLHVWDMIAIETREEEKKTK